MASRKQTSTLGIALAVAVLAAFAGSFIWIAVPLLAISVLLFAWGLEPKRTEACCWALAVRRSRPQGLGEIGLDAT